MATTATVCRLVVEVLQHAHGIHYPDDIHSRDGVYRYNMQRRASPFSID